MAITVTHPKVSAIPDDPASVAAGEVVPSDWNANHTVVVDELDNVPIGGTTPAAGSFTNLNATGVAVFNGAIASAIAGAEVSLIGTLPTTGSGVAYGLWSNVTMPSNATGASFGISSRVSTEATALTAGSISNYAAGFTTLGASSSVTNLYGYNAQTTLTVATSSNVGFFSQIAASGSTRWNFYATGSAPNYFAGPLGIGATTTGDPFRIAGTINHSAFSNAQIIDATIGSSVTSSFRGIMSRPITQNATFTLSSLIHFYVNPQAKGASSTITNQYGFVAESSVTDATNNFGFYSNIAAASGRWNFYSAGTASNYFNGNLGIGSSTFGTSATNTLAILTGTAPTTGPADTIQLYSTDLSAGNTIPSFYTEGTNVGTGTPTANRTIAVRFNGTVYYLLASTIP